MFTLLFAWAIAGCATTSEVAPDRPDDAAAVLGVAYPEARRGDVVDTYFGEAVEDPYRWLEDPDASETRSWITAQNALTRSVIDGVPDRQAIRDRLQELWDFEKYSAPSKRAGKYFWSYNSGLSNQSTFYVGDGPDGEGRALLDPNTLSEDGTVSLAETSVSPDGRFFAYATSDGGSDWQTWRVRDVETGEDGADLLEWVKFSGAWWAPDSSGFYYARFPAPEGGAELEDVNLNQALYFHELGQPQSEDTLVYSNPDEPEWGYDAEVTEDGQWLIIEIGQGTEEKNRVYVQSLNGGPPIRLFDAFDAYYHFIGNDGGRLWFRTDRDAPRGRVVVADLAEHGAITEVIPESEATLRRASFVGGHLVAAYLEDAKSAVKVYTPAGEHVRDVVLPGIGTARGFGGRQDDPETFFTFSSFTSPAEIWRYDVASGEASKLRSAAVAFDPSLYVTEQVFYESADGTRVPMFVSRRADVALDGTAPTLLYGYGGFNIPITPSFKVDRLVWMEAGGIYAVANLRGGGEYGADWHEAGTKLNKQNVFDDFIAAAEHLVAEGYTRPDRLAIEGRSNGGLLAGATLLQRPDLFGAALPGVGVLDMLRYHKFTIGWAWASDYGTSEESEAMFKYLRAYSPVHNAVPADYPATLITTGDHDDRVVPAHSFKFAAALQHAQSGPDPVLIRVETRAGHGAGTPTSMRLDELADRHAFLNYALGYEAGTTTAE